MCEISFRRERFTLVKAMAFGKYLSSFKHDPSPQYFADFSNGREKATVAEGNCERDFVRDDDDGLGRIAFYSLAENGGGEGSRTPVRKVLPYPSTCVSLPLI